MRTHQHTPGRLYLTCLSSIDSDRPYAGDARRRGRDMVTIRIHVPDSACGFSLGPDTDGVELILLP